MGCGVAVCDTGRGRRVRSFHTKPDISSHARVCSLRKSTSALTIRQAISQVNLSELMRLLTLPFTSDGFVGRTSAALLDRNDCGLMTTKINQLSSSKPVPQDHRSAIASRRCLFGLNRPSCNNQFAHGLTPRFLSHLLIGQCKRSLCAGCLVYNLFIIGFLSLRCYRSRVHLNDAVVVAMSAPVVPSPKHDAESLPSHIFALQKRQRPTRADYGLLLFAATQPCLHMEDVRRLQCRRNTPNKYQCRS